jgi:hypothetical protein
MKEITKCMIVISNNSNNWDDDTRMTETSQKLQQKLLMLYEAFQIECI